MGVLITNNPPCMCFKHTFPISDLLSCMHNFIDFFLVLNCKVGTHLAEYKLRW